MKKKGRKKEIQSDLKEISSIQLVFLRMVMKQKCPDVMSLCMQFEKVGCGLLREAFQSERECFVSQKRGGVNKKGSVLENEGEHRSFLNK